MKRWTIAGASVLGAMLGAGLYSARLAKKSEAAVPMDGRLVTLPGGDRLHVHETGEGPPLLLLHGLGAQMRSFGQAMVDELAKDHRVIRVDRPGSGYSPALSSGTQDLAAQADAMAALIDELGLEKPLVVGHSLGGALALRIAERHGDKIRGLALIAPATQPIAEVHEVFKGLMVPLSIAPLVARTIAVPMAMATREATVRAVFKPEPVPADFITAGGGALAIRPSNIVAACGDIQLAMRDAADAVAHYPAMRMPVAILYAKDDNILDPAIHGERTAAQIPGARLTFVEGGHMIPFTQPLQTARWVREVSEASAA